MNLTTEFHISSLEEMPPNSAAHLKRQEMLKQLLNKIILYDTVLVTKFFRDFDLYVSRTLYRRAASLSSKEKNMYNSNIKTYNETIESVKKAVATHNKELRSLQPEYDLYRVLEIANGDDYIIEDAFQDVCEKINDLEYLSSTINTTIKNIIHSSER
jgi:hypothetical protein